MAVTVRNLDEVLQSTPASENPLATEEYFVNMGPQHPIAHGSLRIVLRLDGETVKEVIPVPGFVHRGVEKICENFTYRQIVTMTDRLDYLSALMNNWLVAKTVEKAAGIETNSRIETIRTLMAELQRLQSHVLWWGVLGMDLGAATAFMYGFREREIISELFEETIGARLTMNYIQPGGLMYDIHPNFVSRAKKVVKHLKRVLGEYETLLSNNIILQERFRMVGILSPERGIALGCTGPVIRASGVPYDLRKIEPYGVYGDVDFNVVIGQRGDCWDRYYVRMIEMHESIRIVEQLLDNIPMGPHMTLRYNMPIVVPKGRYYDQIETARGAMGVFLVSDGEREKPYRWHFRSPNFNNLWAVTEITPGWRIADIIAILSSFDLVIPDIDR